MVDSKNSQNSRNSGNSKNPRNSGNKGSKNSQSNKESKETGREKDKGNMTVEEAGRKGGERTAETHGREFYQEIGLQR